MNKFDKALQFCCSTDEIRPWMMQPFVLHDTVHATDAQVMLSIPKEKVEGSYGLLSEKRSLDGMSSVLGYKSNQDTYIGIQELKEAINKVPLINETKEEEQDCEECNGEGEVEWSYGGHTNEFDCPECNGYGYTTSYVKSEKKVRDIGYFIDIGNSRFRISIIEQLIKVATLLGFDKAKLVYQYQSNVKSVFKFGKTEMIIMPVMTDEKDKTIKKFELK